MSTSHSDTLAALQCCIVALQLDLSVAGSQSGGVWARKGYLVTFFGRQKPLSAIINTTGTQPRGSAFFPNINKGSSSGALKLGVPAL